jgi:hypothetical protein
LHKAGSPTDTTLFWVSLKPSRIAALFFEKHQIAVSNMIVKRVLKQLGYKYRKHSKQLATGNYARRDEQFNIICSMVLIMSLKSPIISIDCKKKEHIGNLYREGKCYCTKPLQVYDHDYKHLTEGKIIPHGIYDLQQNKGYVSIGNSSETAEFIKDNLLWWWTQYGIHQYPDAKNILILCDAGGANSYRHHIFKHHLLQFAKEIGISLIVCHYPPYCSKWNPIEHKLFSHIHRAMSGNVLTSYETVKNLIEQTSTKNGLNVIARLNTKEYKTGSKIDKTKLDLKRIFYHHNIKELNYRIIA